MSPLLRTFFFGSLFLVMSGLSAGIAALVVPQVCGVEFQVGDLSSGEFTSDDTCMLRLVNSVNQLVLFLGSSLLFMLIFGAYSVDRLKTGMPARNVLLVPLLAVFSLPLIQAAYELNQALIPDGSALAELAGPSEELAGAMTDAILNMPDQLSLLITLVVVALLPAICEEFAFRGVLQNQLAKATRNVHMGVWLSAFVFSFIHFQFYGFIPRMLLGAFFGYLVVHSGSIWAAVLAHFINNSAAVLSRYLYTHRPNLDLDALENPGSNGFIVLVACVGFTLIFWAFLHTSVWSRFRADYLDPKTKRAIPEKSSVL